MKYYMIIFLTFLMTNSLLFWIFDSSFFPNQSYTELVLFTFIIVGVYILVDRIFPIRRGEK